MKKTSYPGSLHNHTDYSNERLRDCINKVPELIDTAIQLGHEVVAITDHETISSYVKAEEYYEKVKEKPGHQRFWWPGFRNLKRFIPVQTRPYTTDNIRRPRQSVVRACRVR